MTKGAFKMGLLILEIIFMLIVGIYTKNVDTDLGCFIVYSLLLLFNMNSARIENKLRRKASKK